MSWLRAGLVGLLLIAALSPASPAWAAPAECQQYTAHGICVVTAGTDGQGGGTASTPPTNGGGATTTSTEVCTDTRLGVSVPCSSTGGWWSQAKQCYFSPLENPPPFTSPMWGGRTHGALYYCTPFTNGVSFPGTNGYTFWSATPPAGPAAVDPAVLARQALSTVVLPSPSAGRYPAGTLADGRPYTVVGALHNARLLSLAVAARIDEAHPPGFPERARAANVEMLLRPEAAGALEAASREAARQVLLGRHRPHGPARTR